jgi:hypothetical protein
VKKDESVPKMFHRLQVFVNDLKAFGEEVKDKDFFHKFLMTDDTYRDDDDDDDEKEEKKEKKDDKKDEKKRSVGIQSHIIIKGQDKARIIK